MQYWGHFEITSIPYFNKISPGTLIFFGLNMSIFGILRILEVSISVTGAPGAPKFFFEIFPHRCLKYVLWLLLRRAFKEIFLGSSFTNFCLCFHLLKSSSTEKIEFRGPKAKAILILNKSTQFEDKKK